MQAIESTEPFVLSIHLQNLVITHLVIPCANDLIDMLSVLIRNDLCEGWILSHHQLGLRPAGGGRSIEDVV